MKGRFPAFAPGLLGGLAVALTACTAPAEVTLESTDNGVVVKIDGEFFTEYVTRSSVDGSNTGPICYPIVGPTGKEMTRAYPMEEAGPHERKDHPHHRSLWFNHGEVNNLSFWHKEVIAHQKFAKIEGGDEGVLVSENAWLDPDGNTILEDERTLTFGELDGGARFIDFDIVLTAVADEVHFGDTKEGTMGVRVAGPMKVDSKMGGTIVNSHGDRNQDAWGKSAPWVDYVGPVEEGGQTLGIAMMNHPSSWRYPTYWHVRTYGLFAANPFGLSYFEDDSHDGSHTLRRGDSITLRYRIIFHEGDTDEAQIAEAFEDYSAVEK